MKTVASFHNLTFTRVFPFFFFNIFGSGLISCGFAIVIAEEYVILSFEDIYPISNKIGTKCLQDWLPRIVVPKRFFGEIIL